MRLKKVPGTLRGLPIFAVTAALLITSLICATPAIAAEFAYVAQPLSGAVSVISLPSGALAATIPMADVYGIAASPDGSRVYAAQVGPMALGIVNTTSKSVVGSISLNIGPGSQPDWNIPLRVAVSPNGLSAYIADFGRASNRVYFADLVANTATTTVAGGRPHFPAVTPNGALVYVTNEAEASVSVIDANTKAKVRPNVSLNDSTARGIAINRAGTRAYVGSETRVSVLDLTTNTITAFLAAGDPAFGAVAVSPDGKRVYAMAINFGQVFVYDTTLGAELTEIARINAGVSPETSDLLSMNASGSRIYAGSDALPGVGGSGLAGIDTATNTVVQTIPVSGPRGLVILTVAPDTTPPVITPNVSGPAGDFGWYTGPVTVTWNVSDPESGIASTSGCGPTTLSVNTLGTALTCTATNGEGLSSSKLAWIKIDSSTPAFSGMPQPGWSLWPPNRRMEKVATVSARGGVSGLASFSVTAVSNEPVWPGIDIIIAGIGVSPRIVWLRAERLGSGDGRVYTITAAATTRAGLSAHATATCTVPHDQGH